MQSFKEGEIQVAVLCEMGGRGMNLENAKLMIDAYPTMSLNKLEQRHGRVLRKIRKGSKLYKMGWRKSSAVIAQIVPKSLQYRPALFTDIIGGYQQLQEIRAHAEKTDGENGPAEQDIVDVLRRRIEKKDPPHTVRLIREINALEEIKRYDQLPQADASGFFRIPRRYGKPPPTAEQK
jgi:superfamily II DNA or RNA helicase